MAACAPQAVPQVVKEPTAAVPAKAPVVLSLWTEMASPPSGPAMDALAQKFNESHLGIIVMHTKFENTPFETAIKAAYAGGQPPDLATINAGSDTFQYAEAGELMDLTDFLTPLLSNIIPGIEAHFTYKGKYWSIPWSLALGNIIWYNTEMLADQEVTVESISKWSGFLAACEKFKGAGITPIAFGNKEGWNGNHWFTHLLRRLLTQDGYVAINAQSLDPSVKSNVKWNDPAPVKAWELYKELLDKGYFSAGYLSDDYAAAYTYFLQGKAPFFQTGGWFLGTVRDQAKDFPLDLMLFPEIEGYPGKQGDIVTAGLNLVISQRGQHKEEAKEFLKYMMTEEANRFWAEEDRSLVPYKYDASSWNLDPLQIKMMGLLNSAPSAAPFVDVIEDFELTVEYTWNASQGILSGDLTPQQAGDDHEEAIRALRKKKGWE